MKSSVSFISSAMKGDWGGDDNERSDSVVPSISILTRISLFPRPAVFVCFNMKQMQGSRLTKRKGRGDILKLISLTFHCGFRQLMGQDGKTVVSQRGRKASALCLRSYGLLASCTQGGDYLEPLRGVRGFPFIKHLHAVHSEHNGKWSLLS